MDYDYYFYHSKEIDLEKEMFEAYRIEKIEDFICQSKVIDFDEFFLLCQSLDFPDTEIKEMMFSKIPDKQLWEYAAEIFEDGFSTCNKTDFSNLTKYDIVKEICYAHNPKMMYLFENELLQNVFNDFKEIFTKP